MSYLIMGKDHLGQTHKIAHAPTAAEAKLLRDEQEGYAEVMIHGPGGLMSEDELKLKIQQERTVGPA